jgi:subtilisin family serine protease
MKRWSSIRLLLASSVALSFLSCEDIHQPDGAGSSEQVTTAQPKLTRTLDEPLTVWVVMKADADLTRLVSQNWIARGREVFRQLTTTAATSQAALAAYLTTRGVRFQSFWIVNALKVTADRATIAEIGRRPDVKTIVPDKSYSLPPIRPGRPQRSVQTVEWGVTNVRAPEVWSTFGARGEGVVVANIDTGVQFDHPALVNQYRGNNGGSFDHNYNWFDPSKICSPGTPCDNNAHGTHTMGTMVGDDGNPGTNQIGVAPKARWIAAKGCESSGCSLEALMSSGQWMVAPTDLNGANPQPEMRPHIVNNSWSGGGGDIFYQEIVQSWIAAGIFPAFANSNAGPGCATAGSPGDYGISYAVGAHDIMNVVAPFSSRGPSLFDSITKPNISAPGVNVRSAIPGGQYDSFSGTSMATPHLAGVVALIWSAAPSVMGDITATRALLDQTAIDTNDTSCGGTPENNNVYGEGRVDAFAATEQAPRGPTGTLTGTVTAGGGGPIANATITVEGPTKRRTLTDEMGVYSLQLPVGDYAVTASAFGYVSQTVSGVAVAEGATTTQDFALNAAPSANLSGTVTDSTGAPVAGAKVTILATPIPPAVTDAAGKYSFTGIPQGTYDVRAEGSRCLDSQIKNLVLDGDKNLDFSLTERSDAFGYRCKGVAASFIDAETVLPLVGDLVSINVPLPFPFTLYGQTYDSVTVTPKGYLEFAVPAGPVNYTNEAIPSPIQPNAALYAFWDDMIVDGGASVRSQLVGTAPNRQFVIEWRDVSFYDAPQLRARFQILLGEDGGVTYQYAAPQDDPRQRAGSATIGLENDSGTVGFQYSLNEATVDAATAIQFFLPPSGFVEGLVTDANDGKPVSGIEVQALQNGMVVRSAKTNSAGRYRMQVPVGSYVIAAGVGPYGRQEVSVTVGNGQTVTVNFSLKTARAEVKPSTVELLLKVDQVRKRTLTLRNTGSLPLDFEIAESGGKLQSVVSLASLARRENRDPSARDTRGLFNPGIRAVAGWTPSAPGNIIRSFTPTGMQLAWGVGYAGPVWLSDASTNKNQEWTVDGAPTGRTWDAPWSGGWAADMAYDAKRGRVCQLGVGMTPEQNGIHCWDPATGQVTDTVSGSPWATTSQRGLAYRDDDDTFYVGGWNEGIIYHVKGLSHADKGAVIGQCKPSDPGISGLAWNGAMGVLWLATNSQTDSIYELNPDDCTVLSVLPPPAPGGFQGGGLEMDENGDLWMIAQNPNKVYLVESGVPAFNDVPWLSVAPLRGTVNPGASTQLQVTVDTTGLAAGTYLASIFVTSNSAREGRLRVPVSLVVTDYQQGVNAGGKSYKDKAGDSWSADKRHSQGSWGYIQSSSTKSTSHSISGTQDPKLFQSQRSDPYAYRFDNVPNGVYQVELRFAEFDNIKPGKRIFDVVVENTLVLPAHDIVYEVGRFAADAKTFFIDVTDGRADIRLIPRAGFSKPVINALRITRRPDR